MLISDLWSLYEADKRIQGFSTNTLRAYGLQLKILVKELGDLNITEVTLNLLKEYLAKQSNRLKPSSLGHRIRFIRSLFRFAFEETYLPSNPSLKLCEPKMDKRIPKFLVEEYVIHLKISCKSLRERALLEFLYSTGCRIGEVEKINIEDLNWENCSAIVNGKGAKQREVYFTTDTQIYGQLRGERRRELYRHLF
ncbi:tyrosine-type recombinase/integrase [Paenibacillus glycanilyticus]|uniref:tyrosine-type recombinase/integrase n=1 Tax=Paenibacillus glycanilyticus TaxID=126569 RepID=UPI00203EA06B|nr:tyrosine-type recombinase/integrase [Paenibacillus glycanilyticus]MCM3625759.1 tyrosine-type recombinase/integrase [Paenibacillus glycanilyticus]